MSKILITGGGSGLGAAMAEALRRDGHFIYNYDHRDNNDVLSPNLEGIDDIDVLINNAGVNTIGFLEDFAESDWDHVMDVNAKGIFKMTQACLPLLAKNKGTVVNIVSNAAHVPLTGSLAYNASKGAAHIMTLQLARELTKRHGITVFGIAPNKLSGTGMSKDIEEQVCKSRGWTPEYARQYQLNALLAGEETDPASIADLVAYLLKSKNNHKYLTGCVIPYGA